MDPRFNGACHDHDAGSRILLWRPGTQEKFHINDYPVVRRFRTGEYSMGIVWVLTRIRFRYWRVYRKPAISGLEQRWDGAWPLQYSNPRTAVHDIPARFRNGNNGNRNLRVCRTH